MVIICWCTLLKDLGDVRIHIFSHVSGVRDRAICLLQHKEEKKLQTNQ